MPCRVTFVSSRFGKIPSGVKNAIYMEYDAYLPLLAEYLPEPLDQNSDFQSFLRNSDSLLDQIADQLLVQLPHPRSAHYLQPIDTVMQTVQKHMAFVE